MPLFLTCNRVTRPEGRIPDHSCFSLEMRNAPPVSDWQPTRRTPRLTLNT